MLRRLRLLFLFIILSPAIIQALPADSLQNVKKYKTTIHYFYEKDFIYGKAHHYSLDSSVADFHRNSPLLDLHYNYLGTTGSAAEPQIFHLQFQPVTYTGIHSFDLQMLNTDSMKSFRTNKRYTELSYQNASFQEQDISVFHSQNIFKNWNAGFSFDRQGVNDYMSYSTTFRNRFAFFTWYATPNKKYNLFANAIWNSLNNGINGGISSDSLFDNTNVTNLGIKGLAFRIANAQQHERRRIFFLSQYYDFGQTIRDSTGKIINQTQNIQLNYQVSYERKSYVYSDTDPDSSFYNNFYYGSATYDSLHSDELKNRVAIQLPADTSNPNHFFHNFSTGIFAEYAHVKYGQRSDSSWNNLSAGANIVLKTDSDSPQLFTQATYVISGMDKGNYLGQIYAYSPFYKFGRFGIHAITCRTSADLIYRWYDSNNFFWKNNFNAIQNLKAGFSYELLKYHFSIEANQNIIHNYVFMNLNTFPDQYSGTISINQLSVIKNFQYRWWHLDNLLVYQKTDHEGIIHIPTYVTDQSVYYKRSLYKNALLLAIGVSANYSSSYYANAFMPSDAMFYLQNITKTNGYLRLDLFINAQIKTVRFFLKFENVADNLIENSYYLTPHYPMPGRVIKFGLAWRFFDQ